MRQPAVASVSVTGPSGSVPGEDDEPDDDPEQQEHEHPPPGHCGFPSASAESRSSNSNFECSCTSSLLSTLNAPLYGRSTIRMNRKTSPSAREIPEIIMTFVRLGLKVEA